MKPIHLLAGTALLMMLLLSSCRPSDEITGQPQLNHLTTTAESVSDEPKDPPKDVPKDRDNWKTATPGKVKK